MMNQKDKVHEPEVQQPQLSPNIHIPPIVSSVVDIKPPSHGGSSGSVNPPLNSHSLVHVPQVLHPPISGQSSRLPTTRSRAMQAHTLMRPVTAAGPPDTRIPVPYFREGWNKDSGRRGFVLPPLPPILPPVNNIRPGTSWYTTHRLPAPAPIYYQRGPLTGRTPATGRPGSNVASLATTHHSTVSNLRTIETIPPSPVAKPLKGLVNEEYRYYEKADTAPIVTRNHQHKAPLGFSSHPTASSEAKLDKPSQPLNGARGIVDERNRSSEAADIVTAANGLMSIRSRAVRKAAKRVRKRANKKVIRGDTNSNATTTTTTRAVGDVPELFSCALCPEKLKRKFDLKKHIEVVHWKLKKHKCPRAKCNARFGHKGTLTKHLNGFHDKKKPHKCMSPQCDMAFSEKGNLNKHIRSKHPNLVTR